MARPQASTSPLIPDVSTLMAKQTMASQLQGNLRCRFSPGITVPSIASISPGAPIRWPRFSAFVSRAPQAFSCWSAMDEQPSTLNAGAGVNDLVRH